MTQRRAHEDTPGRTSDGRNRAQGRREQLQELTDGRRLTGTVREATKSGALTFSHILVLETALDVHRKGWKQVPGRRP